MPRDDYDDSDRRPAGNSNTTLWIILGVAGGLLLTVVLVCGGLAYYAMRAAKDVAKEMKETVGHFAAATGSADGFLADLQAGNLQAAYQATSQAYRAKQTQAEFEKYVAQFPALTSHTGRSNGTFNMMKQNGVDKFRVQYTLTGPTGGLTCTLLMVEENGQWVVDAITVP